ncbi:ABC transporter substrate-binding protein [Phormidium willei BDU 130791]|nr:ABC transporter substrate-binding protein [Phormidium willei BDU 130791]
MSAAALALTLAGGGAQAGPAEDTLVFADVEEIATFDQYYNTDRIGVIVAHHIFDRLVWRNPETNEIEPMLATAWRWVDDTTLEMELREGVTFHDGESFEAEDVVYTLGRAIDPESQIRAVNNVKWIAEVEQLDDMTVRIHTDGPFPPALEYLAGPIPIYGKDYYETAGPEGMDRNPVGSGPYKVAEIRAGDRVRFEANEDYWTGGPRGVPAIGTLVFRTIPDKNTQVAELMSGGVDWLWKVDPDQGQALKAHPQITVEAAPTMRVGYLQLDAAGRTGDTPMTDRRVRKAIAHAINRQGIVDALLGDGGMVVHSTCFPAQFGCTEEVERYPYDPERARALLAEAGYAEGFEVKFDAYRDRPLTEAMIGNLRDVGITANLNYGRYASIRDEVRAGESAMNFMTWGSYSINDASAYTGNFFMFTGDDTARDAQVRDWLSVADTSTDPAVREAHYAKALQRIAEEMYMLPLWAYPYVYAYSNALNFTPYPDELPRFDLATWAD